MALFGLQAMAAACELATCWASLFTCNQSISCCLVWSALQFGSFSHWCPLISSVVGLRLPSYENSRRMRSLKASERLLPLTFEKQVSRRPFKIKLQKYSSFLASLNGNIPCTMINRMTPRLNISTYLPLQLLPSFISGAMQVIVPLYDCKVSIDLQLANPKSAIFRFN